ncbi:ketopantoate reductase family protein [Streptomyces sp. NBC_00370]|uniref:ketopantoate reductase family protein n=1 Tax=Streptomyces sp. NBC_00370 TaxID=2975728 RepID=UPI002E25488E
MRYIVIGAGAVGGSIGGRLAQAGHDVVLVARGAHRDALREHGLRLVTPDGTRTHALPVVGGPDEIELRPDDVLLLAVKTQDSVAALDAWSLRAVGDSTAGESLPLICAQNGVEGERLALRRFRRVYGMCVWLPSSLVEPGVVAAPCTPYTGILNLGRYPAGADDTLRRIAADLEKSTLLAPVVPDVMRWKYAKLLANLANAAEAVAGPLVSPEARVLVDRARAEGTAVLDAAGIAYADEAEQEELRADRVDVVPLPGAPRGGGSSWQSLSRGTGSIESDYLNGEIVLLGRLHGVPTPVNETLQRLADSFADGHRPAGSMTLAEVAALLDAAG